MKIVILNSIYVLYLIKTSNQCLSDNTHRDINDDWITRSVYNMDEFVSYFNFIINYEDKLM